MIANYHTHSRWCRHAVGEIEDYFEEAVKLGFVELAMTEHVPHKTCWGWFPFEELPRYDAALNAAIAKYEDKIKLYKGFECEYIPQELEVYRYMKEELGYTFLILGQHGCGKNQEINSFGIKTGRELRTYADWVCMGLETGLFVMLAHPEVALSAYPVLWDQDCEKAFSQIYGACSRLHIPVEINVNGFRGQRGYPSERALMLSKDYALKYLINADAHAPGELYDAAGHAIEDWVKKLGIHVEETFPMDWYNQSGCGR
jgi:histidinol phosphatase-like PHP family hydrolase